MTSTEGGAISLATPVLLGALLPSMLGCSYLFMDAAPPKHTWKDRTHIDCTSGGAAPIVDSVGAGLSGAGAVLSFLFFAALAGETDYEYPGPGAGMFLVTGICSTGLTVLEIASASYGRGCARECQLAKDTAASNRQTWKQKESPLAE